MEKVKKFVVFFQIRVETNDKKKKGKKKKKPRLMQNRDVFFCSDPKPSSSQSAKSYPANNSVLTKLTGSSVTSYTF